MAGGARVLIVDDAEDARILYEQVLRREFECETASNGADALELIRSRDFDAVVLDLSMPVMDGWQVLEALRADEDLGRRAQCVIVLSAEFEEETETRARRLGAAAYVAKPVGNSDLTQAVKQALAGRGERS